MTAPMPWSETSPASAEPALIEVRDLVKRFDDKIVLDRLDLSVHRGETVVIIGGSGSGKTTLLRLLIGLERPTSGHISIGVVDIAQESETTIAKERARFAMVFQKYALLDSLSVFDNVAFPLREELKLDETEVATRVMRALEELGVEAAARKLPGELSGGTAKRVGIARAMVTEPEILVYDEPTSGLDPITSRVVDGLIEHMRELHLVTSIVVTHDMMTAYDVADRILLLAHGKIVADGPPEEIFRSHSDEVRSFAASSGLDIESLKPRGARPAPAEISARWNAAHPPGAADLRPWYLRFLQGSSRQPRAVADDDSGPRK